MYLKHSIYGKEYINYRLVYLEWNGEILMLHACTGVKRNISFSVHYQARHWAIPQRCNLKLLEFKTRIWKLYWSVCVENWVYICWCNISCVTWHFYFIPENTEPDSQQASSLVLIILKMWCNIEDRVLWIKNETFEKPEISLLKIASVWYNLLHEYLFHCDMFDCVCACVQISVSIYIIFCLLFDVIYLYI